ncbi:MAG: tRNA sulfurtransferase [Candidatus Thorarchaeota archaeon]|jgi:thiamine biosynthesis protein ThiI
MLYEYDGVLLRCDELQYHSPPSRQQLTTQLVKNLKAALREHVISFNEIQPICHFIYINTTNTSEVTRVASGVFGVSSASPVIVSSTIDTESLPSNHTFYKEVCDDKVFLSAEMFDGVGGLPTGSQGKVVCTISGGLDSPIAAYKMMRRGCIPVFLHFDNVPYGDESTRNLAIRQAKRLTEYVFGHEIKMYIVPHGDDLTEVLRHAPRKMTCIFCRRNMYRLAQEVAFLEEADAIVTGEIIGEQASQTTRNLLAEETAVSEIPIMRPCIGDDKDEIVKMAMKIRTYEFAHEAVSCCSLPPKHPTVYSNLEVIEPTEKKMDMSWIAAEISDAEIIILKDSGTND